MRFALVIHHDDPMESSGACCGTSWGFAEPWSWHLLSHDILVLSIQGRAEWRFLLGNTFLRMLDHLKLDQDQLQTWQQAARDKCAPSIAARKEVGAEEQAALKMLLVMLPEFCMQQAPVLTSRVLRLWESGNAGLLKQRLAEQELRHAHVVGVVLQS